MSRRKQARPSRHLECDEDGNYIPATNPDKKDGKGRMFRNVGKVGKVTDWEDNNRMESSNDGDVEEDDYDMDHGILGLEDRNSREGDDEDDENIHTEDANNNEAKGREISSIKLGLDGKEHGKDPLTAALQSLLGGSYPWPSGLVGPNVTLEAIQNTKMAVAHYAASALNNHPIKRPGKNNNINHKNGMEEGSGSMQELATLQTTLFTLQQQQLLQLQLLQHLQHQLVSKSTQNSVHQDDSSNPNSPSPVHSSSTTPIPPEALNTTCPSSTDHSGDGTIKIALPSPLKSSSSSSSLSPSTGKGTPENFKGDIQSSALPTNNDTKTTGNVRASPHSSMASGLAMGNGTEGLSTHFASLLNCGNQDPNQPLSPGLPQGMSSNNILSSNGDHNPMREPNTLEMLQKRTQEVLDSASQGLLASSLVDDPNYRRKGLGVEKGREPFFKHRCRYCGKVFSSDSALQIHIRSHTGERPFKCNVCGSRFTTKGNLKVHFQRHTSRFPHVRMNPHPVPEHMDHLHPPIRPSSGHSTPNHSPTESNPFRTPPPPNPAFHPFNPLFHFSQSMKLIPVSVPVFPGKEHQHPLGKESVNGPEDLTKPKSKKSEDKGSTQLEEKPKIKKEPGLRDSEKEREEEDSEHEDEKMREDEVEHGNHNGGNDSYASMDRSRFANSLHLREDEENEDERQEMNEKKEMDDDCSMDSLAQETGDQTDEDSMMLEESSQDQPENLSSKSLPLMYPLPLMVQQGRSSCSPTMTMTYNNSISPASRNLLALGSTTTKAKSSPQPLGSAGHPMDFDPAKDPAIYTNLLPRPGSNDNAWESLIEITKTSETAKLQQLVDNIDHKVTDPNQCIICQRVLSCKSALQMHYRTHTGERPFKCKICGRTFTTKGNLKTHMGVHRAKPPLRALLQCPVCHKRFTNSLVLQQHIRLHTGEPTDLTPDQIHAAEIKDFCYLQANQFSHFPSPGGSPPLFSSHAHANLLKQHQAALKSFEAATSPGRHRHGLIRKSDAVPLDDAPAKRRDEGESRDASASPNAATEDAPRPSLPESLVKENVCPRNSTPPAENSSSTCSMEEKAKEKDDAVNESSASPSSQQAQQPFITSAIIPHNNLQFLKVNYVFVK